MTSFPFSSVVEDSLVDDLFSNTPAQPTEAVVEQPAAVIKKSKKVVVEVPVELEAKKVKQPEVIDPASKITPQKKEKKQVESPERLARTLFIGNVSTEVKDKKSLRACKSPDF
jgi:RNA recognition motif-containing protein